jgi:ribose-phosphate pyrophosphokinase
MKTLNLLTSGAQAELKKFAGGECHVRLSESFSADDKVKIQIRLNTSDDIMTLCLAVDALRHMGVSHIEAFIPYMPYARQDRVMNSGEPLSVKVMARIINSLELRKVTIFDAHSDVTVALLDNCHNIPNHDMVSALIQEGNLKDYVLVSPDLGAYKKVDKLAQKLGYKGEIATGIKIRDLASGQITKSGVNCDDLHGKTCIVVDDICDGGRTFIELAAALKDKHAGDLHLIVSHGIFSYQALDRLKEAGYRHVYSSDSICDRTNDDFFNQYPLFTA